MSTIVASASTVNSGVVSTGVEGFGTCTSEVLFNDGGFGDSSTLSMGVGTSEVDPAPVTSV